MKLVGSVSLVCSYQKCVIQGDFIAECSKVRTPRSSLGRLTSFLVSGFGSCPPSMT